MVGGQDSMTVLIQIIKNLKERRNTIDSYAVTMV